MEILIEEICEIGNLVILEWLLSLGIDISDIKYEMCCILCNSNHPEILRWLFANNYLDFKKDGYSALLCTCENGMLEISKWLVNNGAKICDKSDKDNDPIMKASKNGHIHIMEWISEEYKKDKNINIKQQLNYALMDAEDTWKSYEWLCKNGADVTYDNYMYIEHVLENKQMELAKLMYSKLDKSKKNKFKGYKHLIKYIKNEKRNYVDGFIMFLLKDEIKNNVLFDMDIFRMELPTYLFY